MNTTVRLLKYGNTDNIGDVIQTIAVAQHVGQDYGFIERDGLNTYDGKPCVVVMNGWFSHQPENWPPVEAITPIFFGFHMTTETAAAYERHKAYFKKHEPIGCRDQGTADILKSWGVDSYASGCATMTFPRRAAAPAAGKTVLVDVSRHLFDRADRTNFRSVGHLMPAYWPFLSDKDKVATAQAFLAFYRQEAACVITSRIHCAMPCFAMGIPTLYCGVSEYRTKLIDDIGIPSVTFSKYRRKRLAALPFQEPAYDDKKTAIAGDLRARLTAHGIALADWRTNA